MRFLTWKAVVGALCLVAAGCANFPAAIHQIDNGTTVVDYSASRRGAYIVTHADESQTVICAEPAPDIAVTLQAELQATLRSILAQAGDIEAQAAFSEAIIDLARRGQTLQIQREALYRLCELQANGQLSPEQATKLYQEVLRAIQAIAYAELGNSALPLETKKELLDNIVSGDVLKPD